MMSRIIDKELIIYSLGLVVGYFLVNSWFSLLGAIGGYMIGSYICNKRKRS